MSQTVPRLVLCPVDQDSVPFAPEQLVSVLSDAGLIADALDMPQRYRAGEQFLQLVIFLGCSPAVDFEAGETGSEKFCHVHISPVHEHLQFIAGEHSTQLRCPACRHLEKDWQALMQNWQADPQNSCYQCPECGAQSHPLKMNWRKTAGFARQYIEIFNVYPNEAVPADALLNKLEKLSAMKWKYFYVR